MATVPFTVTETAGIARTNEPMRFPICVPLKASDGVLNTNTLRVIDDSTGLPVDAGFYINTRYGGSVTVSGGPNSDTTRAARAVLVDLLPTIGANTLKNYHLDTVGGSAASGITVNTQASYIEVNTGTGGITARVPRTGPCSILRFLQINGGATLINGDAGGLWVRGSDTASVYGVNWVENQGHDYFSNLDTSGDGSTNGATPSEFAFPVKWYTEVVYQTPLKVKVRISRIRCKDTGGVAFSGKHKGFGTNGTVPSGGMPVCWDVWLTFYRGRPEIMLRVLCRSSGGNTNVAPAGGVSRGDVAILGWGVDFGLSGFAGQSPTVSSRDEGDADKVTSGTATLDVAIRQQTNQTFDVVASTHNDTTWLDNSYGWSLQTSGLSFSGVTPNTQLESFIDVTLTNGLQVMPRQWRNKAPMGWFYNRAAGVLRWEVLWPLGADFQKNTSGQHELLGFQWCEGEAWLIPHAGTLTPTQMKDNVRRFNGVHEDLVNGVWTDSTADGPGSQNRSLVGKVSSSVLHDSGAWHQFPPPISARTPAVGMLTGVDGQLSRPSLLGNADRWGDANSRELLHFLAWLDTSVTTGSATNVFSGVKLSMRDWQRRPMPSPSSEAAFPKSPGPLGWRCFGCYGAAFGFGMNDYEVTASFIKAWLIHDNRGFLAIGEESVLHQGLIDVGKPFYRTGGGDFFGMNHWTTTTEFFHQNTNAGGAQEIQQLTEGFPLWYFLTGDEIARELCDYIAGYIHRTFHITNPSSRIPSVKNRWSVTGTNAAGSNTVTGIASTAAISNETNIPIRVRPLFTPIAGNGTLTSVGARVLSTSTLNQLKFFGPGLPNNFTQADHEIWVGAQVEILSGPHTGSIFEVTLTADYFGLQTTTLTLGATSGNGVTFTASGPTFTAADVGKRIRTYPNTATTSRAVITAFVNTTQVTVNIEVAFPTLSRGSEAWSIASYEQMDVKPTPSPALAGATWRVVDFPGALHSGQLLSKTATSITYMLFDAVPFPSTTRTVEVYCPQSHGDAGNRTFGWPLMTAVGLTRCFGGTMATGPGSVPIAQIMWDIAHYLIYCEQSYTHTAALAQTQSGGVATGGLGVWSSFAVNSAVVAVVHGNGSWLNATELCYCIRPMMEAHELGVQLSSHGLSAIFTSAMQSLLLDFLVRWCRFMFMGLNDLSPIESGDMLVRRIPWNRGGGAATATSYHPVAQTQYLAPVEHPTAAARTGIYDFTHSVEDVTRLSTDSLWVAAPTTAHHAASLGLDVLAYVADKKWHATGQTAKRDAYMRKAIQCYIDMRTFAAATNHVFGQFISPDAWTAIRPFLKTTGEGGGESRPQRWGMKSGYYVPPRVAAGWTGGVIDTTPPTAPGQPQITNLTESGFRATCAASTDVGTGVSFYRFFLDGAQQTPDVSTPVFDVTGLQPNSAHTIFARAFDGVGNPSDNSPTTNVTTLAAADTTPPTTPTMLDPVVTGTNVLASWTASTDTQSGVARYILEVDAVDLADVITSTSHNVTLANGDHTLRVRAVDGAATPNISGYSNSKTASVSTGGTDTDPPSTPGGLVASAKTQTGQTISCTASTDASGVLNYDVSRDGVLVGTVTTPSFVDTGLSPGTEYTYAVRARDNSPAQNVSVYSEPLISRTLRLARFFNNAAFQRLTVLATPITAYPFTMFCRFNSDEAATQFLFALSNDTVDARYFALKLHAFSVSTRVVHAIRANQPTVTGFPTSQSVTEWVVGVHHNLCAVFEQNQCTVYLDAVAGGVDSTVVPFPAGLNRIAVGGCDRLTLTNNQMYSGGALDATIWTAALTLSEITALNDQSPFRVRRQNLVWYNAFLGASPEVPQVGTGSLTLVNGPTTADGPDVELLLTDPQPADTEAPSIPQNLAPISATSSTATFTWSPSTDNVGVKEYQIYRDGALVNTISFETVSYTDVGLAANTDYVYRVQAIDTSNNPSGQSEPLTMKTTNVHAAALGRLAAVNRLPSANRQPRG